MIYLELFLEFLKIGLFTFGGGYSMIPFVKETVYSHNWMSESEFLDMLGVSELTPGPIAINMATYVGSTQGMIEGGMGGAFLGAFLATLGVVLPAFIIMLVIAIILKKFMKNKWVQGVLKGITPVALALILTAGIILFFDVILGAKYDGVNTTWSPDYCSILIFALVIIGSFFMWKAFNRKLNPIAVLALSAVIGLAVNYVFVFA